ncbi:MAG: serine hydrolase, partial [Sphingobacteriia bacterium]
IWLRHFHYDIFEPFGIDETTGVDTTERNANRVLFETNLAGEISALYWPMEPTLPPAKFERQSKTISLATSALQAYGGEFLLSGATIKTYVKNNQLFVFVPGQPEYALSPLGKDRFQFSAVTGYFVQFDMNSENKVKALVFQQPNGNFKAEKKQ